jgi:uncharacterized membrane protein YeaQ/YmgE (transglycosylase-associated protein family)
MDLIIFAIIGALAGIIARGLIPGPTHLSRSSNVMLGIAGSITGGVVGTLLIPSPSILALHPVPISVAILGSLIVSRSRDIHHPAPPNPT